LLRGSPRFGRLYHYYHFAITPKVKGTETIEVKLHPLWAELVSRLQTALRREISERRLHIETLPSANVTISASKRYEDHPIFSFFPINPSSSEPILPVSVSTDNPGVFDTSIETEYALLALALFKQRDTATGRQLYDSETIYAWIDRLRRTSLAQLEATSFHTC